MHVIIDDDNVFETAAFFQNLQVLDIDLILHAVQTMLQTQDMIKVSLVAKPINSFRKGLSILSGATSVKDDLEVVPEHVQHLNDMRPERKEDFYHSSESRHLNRNSLIHSIAFASVSSRIHKGLIDIKHNSLGFYTFSY